MGMDIGLGRRIFDRRRRSSPRYHAGATSPVLVGIGRDRHRTSFFITAKKEKQEKMMKNFFRTFGPFGGTVIIAMAIVFAIAILASY